MTNSDQDCEDLEAKIGTSHMQLIEIILDDVIMSGFDLQIRRENGVWSITFQTPLHLREHEHTATGRGATFDEAWVNMKGSAPAHHPFRRKARA